MRAWLGAFCAEFGALTPEAVWDMARADWLAMRGYLQTKDRMVREVQAQQRGGGRG